MRFKSFLDEATWGKYGSATRVEDATDLILSMPGMIRAIKTGNVLYRSMVDSLGHASSIIDSTGTNRYSIATNNLYQIMMDESSALSDFPSRTKSIICATNTKSLSIYGHNRYIILPYDATPIAVSDKSDFINQEVHLLDDVSLDEFSLYAGDLLIDLGIKRDAGKKFTNIRSLDQQLSELDIPQEKWDKLSSAFKADISAIVFNAIKDTYKKYRNNVFTTLANKIMTPGSLDLTLVRAGGAFPTSTKGREVWFEGKALALTPHEFVKTFRQLEEALGDDFSSTLDLDNILRQ